MMSDESGVIDGDEEAQRGEDSSGLRTPTQPIKSNHPEASNLQIIDPFVWSFPKCSSSFMAKKKSSNFGDCSTLDL